jgi:hypothetical protein
VSEFRTGLPNCRLFVTWSAHDWEIFGPTIANAPVHRKIISACSVTIAVSNRRTHRKAEGRWHNWIAGGRRMCIVRNPAHRAVDLRTGSRTPNSPTVPFSSTTELSPWRKTERMVVRRKSGGKLVFRLLPLRGAVCLLRVKQSQLVNWYGSKSSGWPGGAALSALGCSMPQAGPLVTHSRM